MKNKRMFSLLLAMVMMFTTSIPLMASPGRIPQGNDPIHSDLEYTVVYRDGSRYYFGQVIFETFYTDSGEIISREYFDVYLPEAELNCQFMAIMPFDTLSRRLVWLPNVQWQNIGVVNTGSILGHTRRVNMYHDPSATITDSMGVEFVVYSNTFDTRLGAGTLGPGRSVAISIPWNTMSYTLAARARVPGGGWASISITP